MFRRMLVVGSTVATLVVAGMPAQAATVTEHDVQRDVVNDFVAPLTCDEGAPLYTFTTTSDVHVTVIAAEGRDHFTFGSVGTFTAEPVDPEDGPTYTGRFVQRATGQRTLDNPAIVETGSASTSVHGTGSDGSRLQSSSKGHLTFVVTPNGEVRGLEFEKCVA